MDLEQVADSYEGFFQLRMPAEQRLEHGLHGWLRGRFPLRRPDGLLTLEYVGYRTDEPPLAVAACREMGWDFRTPLWLTLRLVRWSGQGAIEQVLEQEVGLGAVPALTAEGAVFLPELRPSCWSDVEAAVLDELAEALQHAESQLAAVTLGEAGSPWSVLYEIG